MILKRSMEETRQFVNGWWFIPTSMIFASISWGVSQEIPGIMLTSLSVSNSWIGLSTLLGLPAGLRFLLGPFVDHHGTKRLWLISMQRYMAAAMLLLAALCGVAVLFDLGAAQLPVLMSMFAAISIMSMFHDVAWGGYFLISIDERDKAFFVGVNAAFVRLAIIFSQGFMVMLAGRIGQITGSTMFGWTLCFAVLAVIQIACAIYHHRIYPFPRLDVQPVSAEYVPFLKVFSSFFSQPRAGVILTFVFLYRIGEGLLAKMKMPFLMDEPMRGGLGPTLEQAGVLNGIFAVIAVVSGGVLGGILLRRYGLRRTILPFAVTMTLPHIGFVWLAAYPVYNIVELFGLAINPVALAIVVIEAFGYGVGFASFAFLQCEASRGPYRATFFALLSGIMMISWILAGSISGFIQEQTGYVVLFVLSIVFALPGIAMIGWLPLRELEEQGIEEDKSRRQACR